MGCIVPSKPQAAQARRIYDHRNRTELPLAKRSWKRQYPPHRRKIYPKATRSLATTDPLDPNRTAHTIVQPDPPASAINTWRLTPVEIHSGQTGYYRHFSEGVFLWRVHNAHGIESRIIKINHPWTNGQDERMNRTIQDATV